MSGYEVLLFFHVSSVIVWLGAGVTLTLVAVYAERSGDRLVLERLGTLGRWLGPRVFAPAALGALAFGLALVADGHWTFHPLWVKLGLAAFASSFLLNAGVRFPALRRQARGGDVGPMLGLVARVELLVLFLAGLDMVAKPS